MGIDIVYIVIVLGVILVSMTLHEAMHAFTSYWLGDDTAKLQGRLTLNPVKHIDPVLTVLLPLLLVIAGMPVFGAARPVPFNPDRVRYDEWGAALIALAGPLTNLLLAFVSFGIWVLVGMSSGSALLVQVLSTMVMVNLGFLLFNMLPIPPLDGSRALYALAPEFVRRGMEVVEQMGVVVIFAIILVDSIVLDGVVLGSYMRAGSELFIGLFELIFL